MVKFAIMGRFTLVPWRENAFCITGPSDRGFFAQVANNSELYHAICCCLLKNSRVADDLDAILPILHHYSDLSPWKEA